MASQPLSRCHMHSTARHTGGALGVTAGCHPASVAGGIAGPVLFGLLVMLELAVAERVRCPRTASWTGCWCICRSRCIPAGSLRPPARAPPCPAVAVYATAVVWALAGVVVSPTPAGGAGDRGCRARPRRARRRMANSALTRTPRGPRSAKPTKQAINLDKRNPFRFLV